MYSLITFQIGSASSSSSLKENVIYFFFGWNTVFYNSIPTVIKYKMSGKKIFNSHEIAKKKKKKKLLIVKRIYLSMHCSSSKLSNLVFVSQRTFRISLEVSKEYFSVLTRNQIYGLIWVKMCIFMILIGLTIKVISDV